MFRLTYNKKIHYNVITVFISTNHYTKNNCLTNSYLRRQLYIIYMYEILYLIYNPHHYCLYK